MVRRGPRAGPIDLYSKANTVKLVELATRELEEAEHRFVAEIVGSNPQAKPRHMLGLDYLRLEEVRYVPCLRRAHHPPSEALKGRTEIAQGEALGNAWRQGEALKGRTNLSKAGERTDG